MRRLGLDGASGRKSSDSEISSAQGGGGVAEDISLHRSTDCIVSKELASSSDSDLLRYYYQSKYFIYYAFAIFIHSD